MVEYIRTFSLIRRNVYISIPFCIYLKPFINDENQKSSRRWCFAKQPNEVDSSSSRGIVKVTLKKLHNYHIMVLILAPFNYFIKIRLQIRIHYAFHITCRG
jgi:hypothetical protein